MGFMGLCDAKMKFLWANVGSYGMKKLYISLFNKNCTIYYFVGSLNDSGVFNHSDLRAAMETGAARLPAPRQLPNSNNALPYFIIGDAGFPLKPYLMTPYSRIARITAMQRIFNYRHSRARRIVECAFGLLKSKWQIFDKPLGWDVQKSEQIIFAIICIHNFLLESEEDFDPRDRRYVLQSQPPPNPPQAPVYQNLGNNPAAMMRQTLTTWCVREGDRDFQYQRA